MSSFSAGAGDAGSHESAPVVAPPDTLTSIERVRILEGAMGFRRMIFATDTTIRLDYCSVARALGPEFQSVIASEVRRLITERKQPCNGAEPRYSPFSLIVRGIRGEGKEAVVTISYQNWGYLHEEDFEVRKASSRPDGAWAGIEMRVYNAAIADWAELGCPRRWQKGLDDRNDGCQTPALSGRPYRIGDGFMYVEKSTDVVAEAGRRAASLADEVTSALQQERPNEWLEEVLASALLEMMRLERDKCAMIAEHRADLWEAAVERYANGQTADEAVKEARERHKEAVTIADAIRFDHATNNG
ncbi:MAG TPA: hypothetical protein VJ825_11835 [Gemmatimonadaceae bacterium]|nr:hypothetical protein [Gemmatimonadaceae bacterium]